MKSTTVNCFSVAFMIAIFCLTCFFASIIS
jgi:hypothetical protein